jgi:nucleotide-binding universal stress UspA family protein
MTTQRSPVVDRSVLESTARVVVATDRSHWGRSALRWAADHAQMVGVGLDVHLTATDRADAAIGAVQRRFPATAVRVRPDADPVSGLIRASRTAALVVLGCRDSQHHGIGLGEAVPPLVAFADCDVVVVGGRPEAVRGTHHRICVLLGQRADHAADALYSAGRFAAARHADIYVVRSAFPPVGRADMNAVRLETSELARLLPAEPVDIRLCQAEPHDVVSGIDDADVLVVAAGDRLDMVARAALHHARGPVLVARGERPR